VLAEVLAVEFEEIECAQDRPRGLAAAVKRVKRGNAILATDHSLPIQGEGPPERL
jgi:hypothetical protein